MIASEPLSAIKSCKIMDLLSCPPPPLCGASISCTNFMLIKGEEVEGFIFCGYCGPEVKFASENQ